MLQRNPEPFHPERWWHVVLGIAALLAVIFGGWAMIISIMLALTS